MDNSNFFVDVPSDASMEKYPSNHGGEFSVDLPISLSLSSHQWEVGLVEAIFTQEWSPVLEKDIWLQVSVDLGTGEFGKPGTAYADSSKVVNMDTRNFEDIWEKLLTPMFLAALEESGVLKKDGYDKTTAVTVTQAKQSQKITIKITPPTRPESAYRLELSQSLLRILGFTTEQLKSIPDSIKKLKLNTPSLKTLPRRFFFSDTKGEITTPSSVFSPSLDRGVSTLWIYTDIIKSHFTGHTLSPLLRIIAVDRTVEKNNGSGVRLVRFDTVDYYPLRYDDVSTIRIRITNQGGLETIRFSSPVNIKLHFRRRRIV